ncbi:MAG: type IX secretion system protein PorQ [Candidatus Kapaibacteriales bacterium]
MINYFCSILFVLFLTYSTLFSKESPFNFLRFAGSARSGALAGAFVSIDDDPTAVFFNPSTIATNLSKDFSLTFFKHVLDVNSGSITYIRHLQNIGSFAGSIQYTNYGSFDRTDSQGQLQGTYTANDLAFGLSYANILDTNLYYGGTIKLLSSTIDKYSSFAIAFDIGLLYRMPEKRTNIGFAILNVGRQLSTFDGTKESLPLDVKLGINHRLRGLPLLLNFSFNNLNDNSSKFFDRFLKFSLGGEFYFGDYVNLRLGYDNNIRKYSASAKDRGFSGFNFGLGIKLKEVNFDYGFSQVGNSASFHRFSVYYNFSSQ